MHSELIEVRTGTRETVVDLTAEIDAFLSSGDGGDGLLHVWVPHATAGIAVIETGAGSDTDLLAALRDLLPADDRWRHRHGSAGHGRDHHHHLVLRELARHRDRRDLADVRMRADLDLDLEDPDPSPSTPSSSCSSTPPTPRRPQPCTWWPPCCLTSWTPPGCAAR